jgi:two-component system chemotaxis response regulator CheY
MGTDASMRVLLVEDDEATRRTLAKAIETFGHTCMTAENGFEAWQIHAREPADVIISDRSMPRMTGDELCQAVRLHKGNHYTHFIFVTGQGARDDVLRGMRMGADDYLVKPIDLDQLEVRLAAASRVVSHERLIARRNVRLRRESEKLRIAAHVDSLTNLSNRLQLREDLRELKTSAALDGARWTAAICDVDWFKAYNDRYGHVFGDRALAAIGAVFRESTRSSDRCYRYGGEEFLVLLRDHTQLQAQAAMDRIRHDIESLRLAHEGTPFGVLTISVGCAEASSGPDLDVDDWLIRADSALYEAKREGRNRVVQAEKRPAAERSRAPGSPGSAEMVGNLHR